jgi:hypothetical protein
LVVKSLFKIMQLQFVHAIASCFRIGVLGILNARL